MSLKGRYYKWDPHEWNYSREPENSQRSHTTVGTLFSHTVNTRTDVQAIC